MKLLKVVVSNADLFQDKIEIDFIASDKVRASIDDSENTMHAFKVRAGLYTQVLMAVTGLNATGKTTLLELLSLISQVVFSHKSINERDIIPILMKLIPKQGAIDTQRLIWDVYFLYDKKVNLLHSEIVMNTKADNFVFEYLDEFLKSKKLSRTKNADLFNFDMDDIDIVQRINERKNPYLKKDISIVNSLGEHNESIFPLGQHVNYNLPLWVGHPAAELLQFFDPNIEQLNIQQNKDGQLLSQLKFKNSHGVQYDGDLMQLNMFLSAGTIKGLTILPAIIQGLKTGGYVFIDEFENHFNKKIIEWFMELFTNKRINPRGACLVFTTHYPELLDFFSRKDNIYISRRDKENHCEYIKYSSVIGRNELSKGKVILENQIGGTAPRFQDLEGARSWITRYVEGRSR